ncbi:biosynthetic-type acetolactate synthase large subunit [Mycolicibacterium baixiangningiae]|uniref:biosynthetic-type acetolactate synthase large subunit n=1 Tax=Mycolicibacterium baixiangningiae TaxID=2761578 RepID=UPI0018D014CB|nr:biosynthetic-type acetolactate synthase large subunit [Mycolicibacterium baixiangningiae]
MSTSTSSHRNVATRPYSGFPAAHPVSATGARVVVETMERLGVRIVFGRGGSHTRTICEQLESSGSLRRVVTCHEQGAGHAAAGYALASGDVGVCIADAGHGVLNLVTALADAHLDSVPVVAVIGHASRRSSGCGVSEEIDVVSLTMPFTKHHILVTDPAEIGTALADAFYLAGSGRPGAVVVSIPEDILRAPAPGNQARRRALKGYRINTRPSLPAIRAAVELIQHSSAPVLYVGGGVVKANASEELTQLAELTGIPVVTTLMARGAFPDGHRLHYGMPGMHGTVAAVAALQRSDLLIALGARFDDRVTGQLSTFAPRARVIHVDIDPAEIGKNRAVDVAVTADCKPAIRALTETLTLAESLDFTSWRGYLESMRAAYPIGYSRPGDGSLSPQLVIETVGRTAGPNAIFTSGVGQHQMWAAHYINFTEPRRWLNSGGMGTMGYAIPAALGAKARHPDSEVWAIDGDGCFQMTCRELATAATENLPIKVALINNGNLGMVKQLQAVHYDGRYSQVDLATHSRRIPDFVALAEGLGCVALRCDREADVAQTIAEAQRVTDRPVVIDFIVNDDTLVWPMVAAGISNDHVMAAWGVRPLFTDAD